MKCALCFVVLVGTFCGPAAAATLTVDPRDPLAFHTLREAAAALKPGDTLKLAPDSGPYREELYIRASGTKDAPIIVEGSGNEITGFDPLVFQDGSASAPVKYPFVLRHNKVRMPEDAATGKFSGGITYDPTAQRLALAPGTSPEGWEISVRKFAVRIQDASHQLYRNLSATGSLNDGFNLHGTGEDLVFEHVTGNQNLDEGFSSHGSIHSEIRHSRFSENDNGLMNGFQTVTVLDDVDISRNMGLGLAFGGEAAVKAEQVRVWENGMVQLLMHDRASADFTDVRIYRNAYPSRPWITYNESAHRSRPVTLDLEKSVVWSAAQPEPLNEAAPLPNAPPQ